MASDREEPAFDALWRRLAPHVRAAVLRRRWSDAALTPDDLVQEVRIRVWQVWSGDRKSALRASYYHTVVNSAIIDTLRRHRGTLAHGMRDQGPDGDDALARVETPLPGPDEHVGDRDRVTRLAAALKALPSDRATAVKLYLQGFSVAEIAELMACDHDRAHNLTYRGVRALKKRMIKPDE